MGNTSNNIARTALGLGLGGTGSGIGRGVTGFSFESSDKLVSEPAYNYKNN